jgi:hypothetical protein
MAVRDDFTAGEVLAAADLNDTFGVKSNTSSNAGFITGTYSPVISGTAWVIGDGTASGQYQQLGKLVIVRIDITFGSTTTFGTGALEVTLPINNRTVVPAQSSVLGRVRDDSTNYNYSVVGFVTGNKARLFHLGTNGQWVGIAQNQPFAFGSGDTVHLLFLYEGV